MINNNKNVENFEKRECFALRVHIYCGGVSSYPNFSFNSALQKVILKWSKILSFTTRTMTILDLRESGWSENQFVSWLLDCDVHMIVAHPHQGAETFQWDVSKLYKELLRLYHHTGFPAGNQLLCPIFTQNKFEYLAPLRINKIINQTLKIRVYEDSNEYYREWKAYFRYWKLLFFILSYIDDINYYSTLVL
jgi:hypothetical protein